MIRVLIADDQPLIRAGMAMLLAATSNIEVVGEAADGAEAVEKAAQLQPDVLLMDVRMPTMDGVEAARRVTDDGFASDPDRPVKVLIITTYNVDETVYAALRAGASGFLLKDAAPDELVRAVERVAHGDGWLDPGVTRGLLREFASRPETQLPTPADLLVLTPREREVLVLVAYGLSNTEIAARLFISEGTVKTHFGRLLMKLSLRDRAQAVATAYQTGLVLPGTAPSPAAHRSI